MMFDISKLDPMLISLKLYQLRRYCGKNCIYFCRILICLFILYAWPTFFGMVQFCHCNISFCISVPLAGRPTVRLKVVINVPCSCQWIMRYKFGHRLVETSTISFWLWVAIYRFKTSLKQSTLQDIFSRIRCHYWYILCHLVMNVGSFLSLQNGPLPVFV